MGIVLNFRPPKESARLALMIERKQAIEAAIKALEQYERVAAGRLTPEEPGRSLNPRKKRAAGRRS
jgi:hypothetical protein